MKVLNRKVLKDITKYACDVCDEKYNLPSEAEACEKRHRCKHDGVHSHRFEFDDKNMEHVIRAYCDACGMSKACIIDKDNEELLKRLYIVMDEYDLENEPKGDEDEEGKTAD